MKLLNQSLIYVSFSILLIISLWAIIFYVNMLDEIKESVDEGMENYKYQIIYKAQKDSSILSKTNFDLGFFDIRKISQQQALAIKDTYTDTLLYMQDAEELELEPVRMLTTAFVSHGNYYTLRIVNSMVEEDDLIENLLWEVVWLYILLVTSIIIINNFVLKRLWKPFYSFLNQIKMYRLGTSSTVPHVTTNTKEFVDLQNSITTLIQHSIETYEQQKQFIGNASHELQTPLAIATNKLELLVEKGNLENAEASSIAEVMQVIERLTRLNKSLLLLTKIENKQFLENHTVSLNSVVKQNANDLEEISDFKNIKISVLEGAELLVDMDVSLANIIISNLLRNAVFHTLPNGFVTVSISENSIKISNTSKSVALDSTKIFTRFYKSNTKQAGTGLGLAIIKSICGLYGFSITYFFEESQHCFVLKVKSAKKT